ncbi:thiol-disulfide isomerase/thioredoxin [Flavobacterium sp. HSC-32F16]|uniref:TlpA disulfide reductase family protein n=1 Tax=Flavobacterium sp. HSC-32F16 TaxID=2910964 RepID=UPI0020A33920|nr:TlpA disulfide reductase family protein [Flavobacterium sp. HSC-32F16]MCP2025832.1 thiol-disulfide isomerase/thioredoxin [Flavobacterium sp. HSC-32F16]
MNNKLKIKIKTSFFAALMAVLMISCKKEQTSYTFKGKIDGAADGTKVFLKIVQQDMFATVLSPEFITDSTIIKNGKFEFSGKIPEAKLYLLVINSKKTPEKPGMPLFQPSIPVFLENSDVELEADLDNIPLGDRLLQEGNFSYNNIEVSGSKSHELYLNYFDGVKLFDEKSSALFDKEYLPYLNPVKGSVKQPISKGVAIVTKIEDNQEKRKAYVSGFIKENINNMVGLFIAQQELSKFSVEELEKLEASITAEQKKTLTGKNLIAKISDAKSIAPGAPYIDLPFTDAAGNAVKISDYAGKGKYVMLEFWASWCHPCRADIPHLKEVYELYHPEGFEIISVSMDQDKQAWLKAVKEEKIPWLQVSDLQAFTGDLAKKYQIRGIPTCILLDPSGKIVTRNMRGSFMDKKLIDLYGNHFGKNF